MAGNDRVIVGGRQVDLGEIERVLEEHAKVQKAAVAVHRADDEERLIAYIVHDGISPTASQLRTHMQARVPDDLMPAAFVSLAALPRTAAGEIDRAALPPPNPVWAAVEQSYVAPRNEIERILAGILAEVLLVDTVGIHDDFLELGGDSLLGAQVVARIFERCGVEVQLEALFERGTIAELYEEYFAAMPLGTESV